jgi:hypothetical protein
MSDGYDRRIGGRKDMAAIPVQWRVTPPGQKRKGAWRRRDEAEKGLLLDLSVSGLQVRAAAADDLSRGVVVHLALDGVHGWGTIRRVSPVPKTTFCDYGIELDPRAVELTEWVHARIASTSAASEADWSPR